MIGESDTTRILGDSTKRDYLVEFNDGDQLTISATRTDCAWGVFVFYKAKLEIVAALPVASVKAITRIDQSD